MVSSTSPTKFSSKEGQYESLVDEDLGERGSLDLVLSSVLIYASFRSVYSYCQVTIIEILGLHPPTPRLEARPRLRRGGRTSNGALSAS